MECEAGSGGECEGVTEKNIARLAFLQVLSGGLVNILRNLKAFPELSMHYPQGSFLVVERSETSHAPPSLHP